MIKFLEKEQMPSSLLNIYQNPISIVENRKSLRDIVDWSAIYPNLFHGEDISIILLGEGCDYKHRDLSNYYGGINVVSIDSPHYVRDKFGHTTIGASLIAGNPTKKGIRGIAYKANLFSIKLIDNDGIGNVKYLIDGIKWSIINQMDIICLDTCFLDYFYIEELQDVCNKFYQKDGIIITSVLSNNRFNNLLFYDNIYGFSLFEQNGFGCFLKDRYVCYKNMDIGHFIASGIAACIKSENKNVRWDDSTWDKIKSIAKNSLRLLNYGEKNEKNM